MPLQDSRANTLFPEIIRERIRLLEPSIVRSRPDIPCRLLISGCLLSLWCIEMDFCAIDLVWLGPREHGNVKP